MIQIDMDMPKACNKETYRNGHYVYEHCKLFETCNKAVLFRKNYKPDNCPLKEVPQEPILDKIRAEIAQMDFDFGDFYDHTGTIIEMVLEVIDKYKAESEDKE